MVGSITIKKLVGLRGDKLVVVCPLHEALCLLGVCYLDLSHPGFGFGGLVAQGGLSHN